MVLNNTHIFLCNTNRDPCLTRWNNHFELGTVLFSFAITNQQIWFGVSRCVFALCAPAKASPFDVYCVRRSTFYQPGLVNNVFLGGNFLCYPQHNNNEKKIELLELTIYIWTRKSHIRSTKGQMNALWCFDMATNIEFAHVRTSATWSQKLTNQIQLI